MSDEQDKVMVMVDRISDVPLTANLPAQPSAGYVITVKRHDGPVVVETHDGKKIAEVSRGETAAFVAVRVRRGPIGRLIDRILRRQDGTHWKRVP